MTTALTTQIESVGMCASSYGELLQGVLAGDEHFLVTIPINIAAKATFVPDGLSDLRVYPPTKVKTQTFVDKLSDVYGLDLSGTITMETEIPEGKGLSSSTADLVAALRAIERFLDIAIPRKEVDAIFRSIEPSDGLLYPHSVAYNHRQCSLLRPVGHLPNLAILSIDQGGTLDTVAYNKRPSTYTEQDYEIYARLLEKMIHAFEMNDLYTIGSIATESGRLNQRFNFKPHLDAMIHIAGEVGAYGVINTHSGTCLGLLIEPALTSFAVDELVKTFGHDSYVIYQTI